MTIKHHNFLVEYQDDPIMVPRVISVRVVMADRLNVEKLGRKFGLVDPKEQPQLVGALWLFFAMLRQGDIASTTTFDEFRDRALDNNAVDEVEVPPTPGESTGSASGSPESSPESTGSPSSPPVTTS